MNLLWLKKIISFGYWGYPPALKVRIEVRRNGNTYFYIHDNSESYCNNMAYTWKMDMLEGDKLEFYVPEGAPLMARKNEPVIFTAELINIS